MRELPQALAAMAAYRQFIVYHLVWNEAKGKYDKKPLVSPVDPSKWVSFEEASADATARGKDYGVGFVLTENDNLFFFDLDNCVEGNDWSEQTKFFLNTFAGFGMEMSTSKKGWHIFGTYQGDIKHKCKNIPLGLELYTSGRFVALTGLHATGNAGLDGTAHLQWLVDNYFNPAAGDEAAVDDEEWRDTPVEEWRGYEDDEELLNNLMKMKGGAHQGFGIKATFKELWAGKASTLEKYYHNDASKMEGDLSMRLGWATGKNHERVKNLMWMSGCVREKWTSHKTYLEITIKSALRKIDKVYGQRQSVIVTTPGEVAEDLLVDGVRYMDPQNQLVYFKDCVYIVRLNKVLTPQGLLGPQQFKATYGGYTFAKDQRNEKTTTNAFEALTESQAINWPKAEELCFEPQNGFAEIINYDGTKYANSYRKVDTPCKPGDPSLFLNHIAKLLPDANDQKILLSWMAASIQYQGVKFKWAVALQGVEGNGKSTVCDILRKSIGKKYVFQPKADKLTTNFNSFLFGKILMVVNDIDVKHDKNNVMESLKPMITDGEDSSIEYKGVDQISADICCNFIFTMNSKSGIKKYKNDRRYAIFYTAQQQVEDLDACGMDAVYFRRLVEWLKEEDGYAICHNYLKNYEIDPAYNPALPTCPRAPQTSSHHEAVSMGSDRVEQEIIESIEQGRPGFRYPWISSMALNKLLEELRLNHMIPHNKRSEILEAMDYVKHPQLSGGRVNKFILQEGGKPRLYIQKDAAIVPLHDVVDTYLKSQNYIDTGTINV